MIDSSELYKDGVRTISILGKEDIIFHGSITTRDGVIEISGRGKNMRAAYSEYLLNRQEYNIPWYARIRR